MKFIVSSILFTHSVFTSAIQTYCSDTTDACSFWASKGECHGNNSAHVARLCPASCNICGLGCDDKHLNCRMWALEGQCSLNHKFMYEECSLSCGICQTACKDKIDVQTCEEWKKTGRCEKDEFTIRVCSQTCNICTLTCKDKNIDCANWAHSGECHNNYAYMLNTCPQSCKICDAACTDFNHTQCDLWKDECLHNPGSVIAQCPETCGICEHICTDKHEDCHNWASTAQCAENSEFMQTLCPASCGVCKDIHANIAYNIVHDEL